MIQILPGNANDFRRLSSLAQLHANSIAKPKAITRWTGEGSLAIQFQGGLTRDELFDCKDNRLRLVPPPESAVRGARVLERLFLDNQQPSQHLVFEPAKRLGVFDIEDNWNWDAWQMIGACEEALCLHINAALKLHFFPKKHARVRFFGGSRLANHVELDLGMPCVGKVSRSALLALIR